MNIDRLTTPWWALNYLAAIWLLCIAVQLVTTGQHFDVAVRDIAMAIAAFTLARLTEAGVVNANRRSESLSLLGRRNSAAA